MSDEPPNGDLQHSPDRDEPGRNEDADTPQAVQRFERLTSLMMRVSPAIDPLAEKLDPSHISAVIENAERESSRLHDREIQRYRNQFLLSLAGIAAVLLLCLIFLAFGATDHLDAVLAAIAGLVGGFGVGRATVHKSEE